MDLDIETPGTRLVRLRQALMAVLVDDYTDPGTAPGAGKFRFAIVAGTTPGTARVLLYAGTSTTPVILADDVGSGF